MSECPSPSSKADDGLGVICRDGLGLTDMGDCGRSRAFGILLVSSPSEQL